MKTSFGLLMYRFSKGRLQVFLAHPGGPFYSDKEDGVWGVPKGMPKPGEKSLTTARREFTEETSFKTPKRGYLKLGRVTQKRKHVRIWAFEGNCKPSKLKSSTCTIEWPPKSGKTMKVPEMDRGGWFDLEEAAVKIRKAQAPLLKSLEKLLSRRIKKRVK